MLILNIAAGVVLGFMVLANLELIAVAIGWLLKVGVVAGSVGIMLYGLSRGDVIGFVVFVGALWPLGLAWNSLRSEDHSNLPL